MRGKSFVLFLIFLISPVFFTNQAQAQENGVESELESCFQYYDYGKISANLATEKNSYQAGEKVKLIGTIVNNNSLPLVDVILYAHLKRINQTRTFLDNGHFLVDRLTLIQDLAFIPKETKRIEAGFNIPPNYPEGEYQLQYFLFSKDGFHYSGRPFLEEDTAGYSTFKIISNTKPLIYFDIDNLKVNGQARTLRGLISEYQEETIAFEVPVIDLREQKGDILVTAKFYSFEDTFEEYLVDKQQVVAGSNQMVRLNFTPPNPGAYVLVLETNVPVKSVLKYRFLKQGSLSSELRMNDLGVTDFPAGDDSRAYVCFHSPMFAKAPETQVSLSVLDNNKQVVETKTITGSFDGEVSAISLPLTKLLSKKDFRVRAQFNQPANPEKTKTVEINYNCGLFNTASAIDLSYDQTKPDKILFQSTDICGGGVGGDKFFEQIRVLQNGEIKQEAYNVNLNSNEFPIEDLPPADYQVEVKKGDLTKTMDFKVAGTTFDKEKAKRGFDYRILLIFLPITIGVLYLLWKRKMFKRA